MILKFESGIFYSISRYEEKDIIKEARFRWNPNLRRWETTDFKSAEKLLEILQKNNYSDVVVTSEYRKAISDRKNKIEEVAKMSTATTSNIQIPAPSEMDYMPFQKAGIEFINSQKNILLADEMGLGKTIQVIGFLNLHPEIKRVLIIVPASLKINWLREIQKWDVNNRDVGILNGEIHDVTITNYESLVSAKNADENFQRLTSIIWDVLILDESHYIKNWKAQRTKRIIGYYSHKKDNDKIWVKGLKDYAKKKILLTGTPILNRPIELFTQLKVLDHDLGRNFFKFRDHFIDMGEYGPVGSKNLTELQQILRTTCMIRREKKDVLLELPDKIRQIIPLPSDILSARQIEEQKKLIEILKKEWDPDMRLKSEAVPFEEISRVRREIGTAKLPLLISHIRELLEEEDKIVVFGHHHDVLNSLYEEFKDTSVIATGQESLKERDEAITRFQNDPKCRLFIGSTPAMGVGITLTSASMMIFAEVEWRPGDMFQAEDRIHRIGQKESVLIQYLVIDGSLESYMINTILEKQKSIVQVMDADNMDPLKDMKELMDSFAETEINEITGQKVEYVSKEVSKPVIQALNMLANHDMDYSRVKNGVGFNGMDTNFGHMLAEKDKLTPRQYEIAKRILKKYKKQIPEEIYSTIFVEVKP